MGKTSQKTDPELWEKVKVDVTTASSIHAGVIR
jgi:hypothetical protein